ncbi:type I restriction enzyme HsdR N-terminal domain-containing protein [Phaeobacter italicus]|uniref:type I restriction enzyme HsdR N-terminal domain-containing protein n=1 Tax=Phaeobacter italicus TaxID=481446 RepID=UPI00232B656A|nr:type I restriction enzyme HsdR N-terminal domain-containing protein [Phaeobacter italicus]
MTKPSHKKTTRSAKRPFGGKSVTNSATKTRIEAELETRIAHALKEAFPTIATEKLRQQRQFTLRLGHETHEFDSAALWKKTGRADILLFLDDRPLAVLEIKRESVSISQKDYEQAQSYANMLTPRPPLVVVSNGVSTECYDANTGERWRAGNNADEAVRKLLVNAAKVAAADMRWAIEGLLGRETNVWPDILRSCTTQLLSDLTDPPGASGRPIARDILFPRFAAKQAIETLKSGPLFTLIDGPPASGKTNLLREIAEVTKSGDELAVLMMRGSGPGLFQSVTNLFAAAFEWALTPHDTRQWLRRMSRDDAGPTLVLAIDVVEPRTPMAVDLDELEVWILDRN